MGSVLIARSIIVFHVWPTTFASSVKEATVSMRGSVLSASSPAKCAMLMEVVPFAQILTT